MAGRTEKKEAKAKEQAPQRRAAKAKPQGEGAAQAMETAGRGRALSPFEEADRWLESFFPRGWRRPTAWEWPGWPELRMPFEGKLPRVDVIDREDEVVLRAEVPGVRKEDLDVSLAADSVCIRGSTRHEEEEERGDYYRRELSRGDFSRTIPLPTQVDADKARARFQEGVLEITLPKTETAKRKSIKVD